jgi:hypothetical protein
MTAQAPDVHGRARFVKTASLLASKQRQSTETVDKSVEKGGLRGRTISSILTFCELP